MGKTAHGGDFITNGKNLASLLGKHLRGEVLNGFLHQGDDLFGLGLQLLQTLPELAETALQTPVVNVVAGIEDKAVGKGVVLLKGQLDGLMVFCSEKVSKTLKLLRGGRFAAMEYSSQHRGCFLSHAAPPLPCPGTDRRDRRPAL